MTTRRQVWLYKCDFCKKANCSAPAMKRHEEHCTANPNRKCGMCEAKGGPEAPLAELISIAREDARKWFNAFTDEGMPPANADRLRTAAGGCPACMLAAIRQGGKAAHWDFDFTEEAKSFWQDVNSANGYR